jgi:hypothetical protein
MARQEKYFQPVKDLISADIKAKLVKSFFDYKNNLPNFENNTMVYDPKIIERYWEELGFKRSGLSYKEFEGYWKTSEEVRSHTNPGDNFARFYQPDEKYSWLDDDTEKVIKELSEFYGCNHIVFLYTNGNGVVLKKHTDPNNSSKITFPLYPDYDTYRNCNFYDSMDQKEPTYTVDYSKIRSPVLLNVDKIHALEDCKTDESLCIQFSYNEKYDESIKFLSNKGLLNTSD